MSAAEVRFRYENDHLTEAHASIGLLQGERWRMGGWFGDRPDSIYITDKPEGYFLDPKTLTETK